MTCPLLIRARWIRSRCSIVAIVVLTMMCIGGDAFCQSTSSGKRASTEEAAEQLPELPNDPAAIIAVVGQTPVLLGDLEPKVQARINEALAKSNQTIPDDQLKIARINLTRGMLAQTIQNKMMRESFLLDQVGTQASDKRAEADATLATRARQMFFESEIPELMEQYEAKDLNELNDKLREKGTSLSTRQRDFVDQMLGHLYIRGKVDRDPEVSLAEINEYYRTHIEEYQRPTRARWEQLTVLFKNFPNRDAAYQAIWDMGREAYFGGSMQAVAREKSQEPLGPKGGVHDWTSQGALASEPLDEQIFSIPLNAMSEIIEDEQGFHIVRVLERQEAGTIPLSDVQDEIRATLRQDKIAQSQRKVMEEMRLRIPVWSLFPKDVPGSQPLPPSIARRYTDSNTGPKQR